MHANAKRLPDQERNHISELQPVPSPDTLGALVLRFMRLLRLAFWRAFQHDAFAIAKASAYSSILSFFPVLLVVGSFLATWRKGQPYLREITFALNRILPAGSGTAMTYLQGATHRPVGLLVTTSLLSLWTASGVMISWMEGFRRCYELPKTWGLVKERLIAFSLVPGPLRRLQHHLRLARRRHRPAGMDVHDLTGDSRRRRIQRHAVPASDAGKRTDRDQWAQSSRLIR